MEEYQAALKIDTMGQQHTGIGEGEGVLSHHTCSPCK